MKFCTFALLTLASLIALSSGAFVPETDPNRLDVDAVKLTCKKLLRLSPEAWQRFSRSQFDDAAGTHCMVRCVGILTGLYDDESGIDMDLAERGSAMDMDFNEFKREYQKCAAAIQPIEYGDDYCKKVPGTLTASIQLLESAKWSK